MLTKEDIQLLSQLIDEKLEPMNNRLDKMDNRLDKIEERLEAIEENTEITRAATNELVKWVEVNADEKSNPFPVDRKIV